MTEDVFCKILKGEMQTEFIYKDDEVAVIRDIHPQAPVHLLIMPVAHYTAIKDIAEQDQHLLGKMLKVADRVAVDQGLEEGYRLIINEGEHGGKLVPHLHMHLLGGRKLGAKIVAEE